VNDPVLHLALVDHEYRQHAITGQGQKLDLTQGLPRRARHRDHAGLAADGRQQRGRALYEVRGASIRMQFAAQRRHAVLVQLPHLQQAVDEEAIPERRGHAPRRGVRRMQETTLLEIGHDVADRRRAQGQARLLVQGARPHRLAVADVTRHQHPQQGLRTIVEFTDH
jgi:hypothetical protein